MCNDIVAMVLQVVDETAVRQSLVDHTWCTELPYRIYQVSVFTY